MDISTVDISSEIMQSIFDDLEELEITSSTLGKHSILLSRKDDRFITALLKACYNPFKKYGIKIIPVNPPTDNNRRPDSVRYWRFLSLLNRLYNREITGGEAVAAVGNFFIECSPIEYKWYSRILQKDLNIGINIVSINDAIPFLIPTFNVQLAYGINKVKTLPKKILAQPKLDGKRCIADTTTGSLTSRKGHSLSYPIISEALKLLPKGYILDGEIFSGDFNQVMRAENRDQMALNAFDIVPVDEFSSRICRLRQADRTKFLSEYLLEVPNNFPVRDVKTLGLIDNDRSAEEKLTGFYNQALSEGYEGIMIKDALAPYAYKRSRSWLKLKPENTIDLKVVDVQEGKPGTKYEGILGALIVEFDGINVGVGSGLNDDQRIVWGNDPSLILGKTIEVGYQEVTKNLNGYSSLRFPKFMRVRDDK